MPQDGRDAPGRPADVVPVDALGPLDVAHELDGSAHGLVQLVDEPELEEGLRLEQEAGVDAQHVEVTLAHRIWRSIR